MHGYPRHNHPSPVDWRLDPASVGQRRVRHLSLSHWTDIASCRLDLTPLDQRTDGLAGWLVSPHIHCFLSNHTAIMKWEQMTFSGMGNGQKTYEVIFFFPTAKGKFQLSIWSLRFTHDLYSEDSSSASCSGWPALEIWLRRALSQRELQVSFCC